MLNKQIPLCTFLLKESSGKYYTFRKKRGGCSVRYKNAWMMWYLGKYLVLPLDSFPYLK